MNNKREVLAKLEQAAQLLVEAQVLMKDARGIAQLTRTLRTDLSKVLSRVRSYGSKR